MNDNNEIDGFLFGGGGKSASFENPGDNITGTIVSAEVRDQTDIGTGAILKWDNGDVRTQLVVTLETNLRDDEDDDGHRSLYVKGSKKAGSRSLHDAVASAVRGAGVKSLEIGGTLTVTHDGVEPSKTRGFNDRKLYSASYVAPDRAAQTGNFLGTAPTTTAPPAVQQQATPAPQTQPKHVPAAVPPALSPEQAAAFAAWQQSQGQQQTA